MTSTSASAPPGNLASKYQWPPPTRKSLSISLLYAQIVSAIRTVIYLTRHTLGVFEPLRASNTKLTLSEPAGAISHETLDLCKELAKEAEERAEHLEAKSTALLSLIAVVIPLTASAAVFIRQHSLPVLTGWITLGLDVVAMLFLLLGLFAALRALAIRAREQLFLDAVIDRATDTVRSYSDDFWGRGLLYVASAKQALCDHIADFARSAQLFLVLGVALAVVAVVPILFHIHEDTQTIHGTVAIDPKSWDPLQKDIDGRFVDFNARLSQMQAKIELMREAEANASLQEQIERLKVELADLQKEVKRARRAPAGR